MSTENLDRGTGPLRLGAGRVWAHVLISRNVAGLAGKGLCGMGFMRDGPIEPAVGEDVKWALCFDSLPVNKDEAGYDGESWCRLNTI
ncbi:hypothetical protein YC2023_001472 [Brassica napus]